MGVASLTCKLRVEGLRVGLAFLDSDGAEREAEGYVVDRVGRGGGGDGKHSSCRVETYYKIKQCVWAF